MTQLVRRVIYLVAGLVPACCGALVASAMRGPLLLGALAGACGLLLASMDVFPVRRATYWCIAILLSAGLAAMLPFSVSVGYGDLADLASGMRGSPTAALVRSWLLLGPPLCAAHFLWAAKPKSLRGST